MVDEANRLAKLLAEQAAQAGMPVDLSAPELASDLSAQPSSAGHSSPPAHPERSAGDDVEPRQDVGPGAESKGPVAEKKLALPVNATLAGALEAVLLVANDPMSVGELMKVLDGATRADLNGAVRELRERYASRPGGFELTDVAGGIRLLTRPEYAPWVERLEKVRREERLSKAQLEVLAVIAYRQPVLRADVDSVRGADSGGALRGLVDKGMVKVVGRAEALGRPLLYGTTDRFLERFALKSVKELPRPKAES